MGEGRNTDGQFTPEHTDDEILGAVRAHEPAATSEVADEVGMTRQGADRRLRRLRDEGRVSSKKIAASLVWFGADAESGRTPAETPAGSDAGEAPAGDAGARERTETAPGDAARDDGDDDLADALREHLEATDQNPQTPHGRGVVVDVFRLLREHGTMSTGDLQEAIYPDYREQWGSERTMWNAVDRYLEDIPGIEKGGYGEWTYTGDDAVRAALDEP